MPRACATLMVRSTREGASEVATWPDPTERSIVPAGPTDAERDRVVALLRLHCTEGRISLDEFSDRVGFVFAADSAAELDRVVHDLPAPWRDEPRPVEPVEKPRRRIRWLVSVFSDNTRRGQFAIDEESAAVSVFGGSTLDLRDAHIEGPETVVTAVAVFGDVKVIVPDGIRVSLEGVAIFGSRGCELGPERPLPGSPEVIVRAFAVFGDVGVRSASEHERRRSRRPRHA